MVTCHFDGLSDWENYKIAVFVAFFVVLIDITPVFIFYTKAVKHVYNIVAIVGVGKFHINIGLILCALVCLIFSFNCALTAYTIAQFSPYFYLMFFTTHR